MNVTPRHPRESGRDYAMRVLRENIISLELRPGITVSENGLAAELGLSRTPVREALIELSKSQVVEILPQIGSRISLIDMELVHESIFLRSVLEKAVVELACDMAEEADLLALTENVKLQEFFLDNPSSAKLLELDDAFHRKLFEICRKERIYELMKGMTTHFDRLRNLTVYTVKDIKIVGDHRAVLEAIQARDKAEAVRRMEEHLMRYRVDDEQIRREYPEFYRGS